MQGTPTWLAYHNSTDIRYTLPETNNELAPENEFGLAYGSLPWVFRAYLQGLGRVTGQPFFFFKVVTWGSADSGGDSRLVSERLRNVWDVQATAPR